MFRIRPAEFQDLEELLRLAGSLSARGFLTLPSGRKELENLILRSEESFGGKLKSPDEGRYLFALEDANCGKVAGSSLIIACHGTAESPHIYFEVNPERRTLQLRWDHEGRTELGGLILDPGYRGRPEKLGKRLSFVRLLYIGRHRDRFRPQLIAELLPPFTPDGKSPLWEALGRQLTGLDYREADERSRKDKRFVAEKFPREEIPIDSLPADARMAIGQAGPETLPVARILEEAGFRYLNQVDPFDGGPHFGAGTDEVRWGEVERFLMEGTGVELKI